ncbi:MAG: hypothetical protein WC714_20030 [Candidatus Obscuribacterales bacterium]|jgi:hypothetical protein
MAHVGIGSELEVVFTPAPRGSRVEQLINGRPAYATESGPAPLAGDRWKVQIVAMNPRRTVYFVEPIELVEAADGLSDVLRPFSPFYHEFIRKAEADLAHLLARASARGKRLAKKYLKEEVLLPEEYRALKLAAIG